MSVTHDLENMTCNLSRKLEINELFIFLYKEFNSSYLFQFNIWL